mgnify:CR=1 FL=1
MVMKCFPAESRCSRKAFTRWMLCRLAGMLYLRIGALLRPSCPDEQYRYHGKEGFL